MLKKIIPKWLKDLWSWLHHHHPPWMSVVTAVGVFITFIGILYIHCQLKQSIEFKKYDNFKYFNKIYDDWYDDMPLQIVHNEEASFSTLDASGKAWVRRYFNLYAQEYYLYKKEMIPKEMWEKLIHGCKEDKTLNSAFRNIQRYPSLLEGYYDWKQDSNAFGFPSDFTTMLENELGKCGISKNDQ